ncbi:MAG TPA: GatB/YqeY domain-containing protein [Stellaceae bacterium]|nr:GatB/YqeY domain-containing protein [Stellaceae bacterium]
MLRQRLKDALGAAMKEKNALTVSTVRLILAKLKEQDIEIRAKGKVTEIGEAEIQQMMQGMVKQRRESITLYEQGGRPELAEKERGEISIIERFLPKQLSEAETETAVKEAIAASGAQGIKDMGRVMAVLKERYTGQMDTAKASQVVKRVLGAG